MTDAAQSALNDLDHLLDEERSALLAGELDEIDRMFTRKSDLIEKVARGSDIRPEALEPLQKKLRRNRELFEQALAGLRSVAARLQVLRELQEGPETYDGSGRRKPVDGGGQGRLEKRA